MTLLQDAPVTKTRLKGGSLSGTYDCVAADGRRFVRKEVSLSKNREYGFQRWYSQLKRMQRYSVLFPGFFPPLVSYGRDGGMAYFDMEYIPDAITVHEFLLRTTDTAAIDLMFAELVRVTDAMYRTAIPSTAAAMDLYVYEEIEQKLLACRGNARFDEIAGYQHVVFNGTTCRGLAAEVERFRELARSTYRQTAETFSHGNLTLENVLYQPASNRIILIDPYEENVIDSALADYSQVLQSCNSKYEIYNACKPTLSNNRIDAAIEEHAGLEYFRRTFDRFLHDRYPADDRFAIRLLEISQFARMLPFKMEIDEDKMVMFYGLGSYLFHELTAGAAP